MTIYDRIKETRILRGLSQDELAKRVGYVGRSAIAKVESGQRDISQSMVIKYAEALGVSPAYLITGEEANNPIENVFPVKTKKIPLLGDIACGEPIYADEQYGEYVDVDADLNVDFCLRCVGDSMIGARIYDGDIVFCISQNSVDNGEIAVVIIEDEATLKRVYLKDGKLILNPENPAFLPLVFQGEELNQIRILGKAVAFQSRVK